MTDKIRWGILSTGNIAHSFSRGFPGVLDGVLHAVGSRTQAAADAFGDEFNIPRRYGSYEALAQDPEVDAIYIGTPHPFHMENSLLCLDAGKAVLCEKPFTINAPEAAAVIRRAREKRVFIMEAMWTRFTPVMGRVRELIAQGVIGEPRMMTADFGYRKPFDVSHRSFNPDLGGGGLLDVGIYPISLAFMVLGRPQTIVSAVHMASTGVDEQAAIIFKYSHGELALLSCATRVRGSLDASICGTEGQIKIGTPWWKPQHFTLSFEGKDDQVEHLPFRANGYEYEADEVNRCLREGRLESDILPLDESLAIMETLDAIRAQWGMSYPMESVG